MYRKYIIAQSKEYVKESQTKIVTNLGTISVSGCGCQNDSKITKDTWKTRNESKGATIYRSNR